MKQTNQMLTSVAPGGNTPSAQNTTMKNTFTRTFLSGLLTGACLLILGLWGLLAAPEAEWMGDSLSTTLLIGFPSLLLGSILLRVVFSRRQRLLLRNLQRNYASEDAAARSSSPVFSKHRSLVGLAGLLFLGLWTPSALQAQSCNCKEYIYLNEPVASAILKFEVGSSIPLTEKSGANGAGHWYPGSGTSQLGDPHGLATDLNGKLYIGSASGAGSPIRQFDCDGNLSPTGGSTIVDNGANTFNMFSIGNIIYKSGNASIRAFNSCTGKFIGEKPLSGGTGGFYWGLSYNKATGTVYASEASGTVWKMSVAELNDFSTGKAPLISKGPNATVNLNENYLPNTAGSVFGVVGDNSGNIYVVFSSFGGGSSSYILKYNSAGKLNKQSPASPAIGGLYSVAIGIVWSETTNRLYTSNYTDDPASDCISAFDASSMAYLGTAAPNPNLPADNRGKAIGIIKECCPVNLEPTFTRNVCGLPGQKFYLNSEAFNTCDGIVCGSSWTPVSLNGMTFDPCDNSVTITGTGCGVFTLNIGAVSTTGCGPQTATFTICNMVPPSVTNGSPPTQTLCEGSPGADLTVQTDQNAANNIRFVRFSSDQMAGATPTAAEAGVIYAGGTTVATVTPTGGGPNYTATLSAATAGWNTLAPGTYYVYAIYNSDAGAVCSPVPVQEFVVTITDKPDISANNLTVCESTPGAGATVNLTNLVQNPDGSTLAFFEGANPLNASSTLTVGIHTITVVASNPSSPSCQTTVNFSVEVLAYPTAKPICAGQTFTLTAPADATNVTWYRDGVAVGSGPVYTVDRPGAYTYIATSTAPSDAGCQVSSCCPAVFTEGVCMSVGSTVWYDSNDNGIYDQPGENPIPGVKVELYDMGGNLVKSTITDPNGDYYFGFLAPGMYTVKIPGTATNPILSGYVSSTNTNTAAKTDNNDNGDQPGGIGTVVTSEKFTLVHNAEPVGNAEFGSGGEQDNKTVPAGFTDTNTDDDGNMTIDFGFAPAPKITHEKTFVSAVPQSNHSFLVTYKIKVKNEGAASTYSLYDTPFFDDDITINSASYVRDIPALGVTALPTTNTQTNTLGSHVAITLGQTQTYTLTYNVTLDLRSSSGGDNIYTACGSGTPGKPTFGEALYNQSALDNNDDGTVDETDEACGDIPYITHNKDQVTVSSLPNADGTYTVVYTVQVKNLGGASGTYDLVDTPAFDDDIVISAASYSTTNVVPAVAGGALALINNQPNTLANDISIAAGVTQTYTLTYRVKLDLAPGSTDGGDNVYNKCGTITRTPGPTLNDASVPGQGLYNSTALDLNNDKVPDEGDEICADLPFIVHTKKGPFISAQKPDRSYDVTYTVEVKNLGGATGIYDLNDTPTFDDDIKINTASYIRDQPALGTTALSTTNGVNNVLGNDISIDAGAVQTYTLSYNVTLDLASSSGGDNIYTKCGSGTPGNPIPGEGLYNATSLDLNNDGIAEQTAKVCGDLPYVTHKKSGPVVSAQKADGSYDVTYTVKVSNTGGAAGVYTLYDKPTLENNITINSATYTSDIIGLVPNPLSLTNGTQNTLASNQSIAAGTTQTYTLKYNVTLNLKTNTPGVFDPYTACGSGNPNDPAPGEGLYNMTSLDDGANGSIDETDEVCGDLPYITHNKDQVSVSPVPNADGTYTVVYTVKVKNLGGAKGTYDLVDTPSFDDDIVIKTASYSTSNVVPAVAGGALSLINKKPNTLANDISIGAFSEQTYTLTYNVKLDLAPSSTDGGDNTYTKCGTTTVTPGPTLNDASVPGQGLYNATALDTNNDNKPEEEDEICADIPYIIHTKKGPFISAQKPDRSYDVTYTVEVKNLGGATGIYDLKDTPTFDDDIKINTASYVRDQPALGTTALSTTNGVSNTLGNDISIDAGAVQTYTLSYNVKLDLSPSSGGDNIYTACGAGTPGDPIPGEGLYNMTTLDLNNDGIIEQTAEVCGDLPYVTHKKSGPVIGAQLPNGSYPVTYTVTVRNTGGATGVYTLYDTPGFENNITINSASYTSSTPPGLAGGLSTSNNTQNTLASNQSIAAGTTQTYTLKYNVTLNLKTNTPGVFDPYTACGSGNPNDPAPGEGLYNMTSLDDGANSSIDETDEVCGDLPYITHNKDQVSVSPVPNADGTYTVVYTVKVKNLGGAKGTYDLVDTPSFDDDIVIKTASYSTSNVVPAIAGGALALINKKPNTLANDISIAAFDEQTYTLTYNVKLDLAATSTDGGDNVYTKCGTTMRTPGATLADASKPGEGLYNATALDTNNDNTPEEEDEICADIPYIIHAKAGPVISAQQADGSYNVTYTVTVKNLGGAAGPYDLVDTPTFDDDITINSASYLSNVPSSGPLSTTNGASNTLANDVIINPGTTQTYTLSYNVTLNLGSASGGDNVYTACGTKIPGQINPGEGLYNKTTLDLNNDQIIEETAQVCGDLPVLVDYGDLPDTQPGVSSGDYQTVMANNGARHQLREVPNIYFGNGVDSEKDGQPDLKAGEDGSNGDDGNGSDDEDGVTKPVMIFQGQPAKFTLAVKTNTPVYIYGYIDWNNDGKFDGPGEVQSTTTSSNGDVMLTYAVPVNAVAGVNLGARFRIGSIESEVNVPNGPAKDGEVEDYLVVVKALDYGDLPAPYLTLESQDGPRHAVPATPLPYLGKTVDIDPDGQPDADAGEKDGGDDGDARGDDEDGVVKPAMLFQGEQAAFQVAVVNKGASTAYVYGYIDWNKDGDFLDAEEVQNTTVAANSSATVTLTFKVPIGAMINTDLGARFRVGTDQSQVSQSFGFAMDGEVEDYLVRVKGLDYGDLNTPPYKTRYEDNGPRHGVSETPTTYLGTTKPDVEPNGQPSVPADGDGADEDGVTKPTMLFAGEKASFVVDVKTTNTAYLYGYIDWNKDGDFADAEEVQWASVTASGSVTLTFNVPLTATINMDLGARFRIGTVQSEVAQPVGFAMDGEVEDYLVRVKGLDYGDLPSPYPTTYVNNGARHGVSETPTIYMGGVPDTEIDGQPDANANGDTPDEDGVTKPVMIFQGEKASFKVDVTTNTTAYIYGYIDWNKDGDFNDVGEVQNTSTISNGTVTLTYDVPLNAVINSDLGVRFRIGSIQSEVSKPVGFAMDGEVEDYLVQVKGLDYGDLPDFFAGVSTGDYQTTYANNGARHGVAATPKLFLGSVVDVDADGQPDLGAGEDGTGGDDNDADGDDEDGVVGPPMIFRGEEAKFNVTLNLTNLTGTTAYVYGFIDWNGNGILGDTPNEIASKSSSASGPVTLTFNVPLGAVANSNLGARFRVGTIESQVNVPNGFAMDGEVEDYLVRVKGLDFGDLPLPYATLDAQDGPRHAVSETPQVYMGNTIDIDDDGQPDADAGEKDGGDDGDADGDDEDGVIKPVMLFQGEKAAFQVAIVNKSASTAYVYGYIDWNKDGDFLDAEEVQNTTVAANSSATVTLTFNVPLGATINSDLGARFRVGTDQSQVSKATGFAMDGEVEDYLVRVKGLDYGDLPSPYPTLYANNGPRHGQPENPQLYLGGKPDVEADGQPDVNAGETGNGDGADEDGVVKPAMLFRGQQARFKVNVSNTSGQTAFIYGYIDWNKDGDFNDVGEVQSTTLDGSNMIELVYQVPMNAVIYQNLGARFRIGTVQTQVNQPTGFAMDGEVEDYFIQVKGLDFGDAGETFPTTEAQNGARHGVPATPNLYFGTQEDVEADGQPDANAGKTGGGDDGNGIDDEDGITMIDANGNPTMLITCLETTVRINTVIPANTTAYLQAWIDYNDDGDWADAGEQVATDIALTSANGTYYLKFKVPCDAKVTDKTFLRYRLSTVKGLSYTGFAMDGEVEDYVEIIKGLDFGDLPTKPGTSTFPTLLADNGPHHVFDPTAPSLYLGKSVDTDQDGAPTPLADGDDKTGTDDEDGITFLTPLIPGQQACIKINAVNNTSAPAYLYAYMDNDGDCVLSPLFNILVPVGGLSDYKYCFTVPTDNNTNGAMAFFRFRLGTNANEVKVPTGLAMNGEVEDYKAGLYKVGNLVWEDRNNNGLQDNTEKDLGINGVTVALVYAGANGTIETDLSTLPSSGGVGTGDDYVLYTTTASQTFGDGVVTKGIYYFCGLIEGKYDLVYFDPKPGTATVPNNISQSIDEDKDSDGLPITVAANTPYRSHTGIFMISGDLVKNEAGIGDQDLSKAPNGNDILGYPDNRVDQRFDQGYIFLDYGDLPQEKEIADAHYNTTRIENGPRHLVKPNFYLGNVVDAEVDGQPDAQAGSSAYGPSKGDDALNNDPQAWKQGVGDDDEDGIKFLTPLIPGYEACIELKYALPDNFDGPDGYLNAWIDYNGNGVLDAGEKLAWSKVNGAKASVEANTGALELDKIYMTNGGGKVIVCFKVPADAAYFNGNVFSRFRLSENPNLGPDGILPPQTGYPNGKIPCGEVEDYFMKLSKVGNLVWEDRNYNGLQDVGEPPIKGVPIKLEYAGLDGKFGSADKAADLEYTYLDTTDVNGRYYFCGLIGDNDYDPVGVDTALYQLTAQDPAGMTPTVDVNSGAVCNKTDSNGDDTKIDDKVTSVVLTIDNPMGLCKGEKHPVGINDQQDVPTGPLSTNVFPDMQVDETIDFGYVGFDYGDLPVAGTSYLTLRDSMSSAFSGKFGPRHAIQPKLYLGEGVDGELNGQPDADAGSKNGGDDDGQGKFGKGSYTDDETGIRLLSPMIPGELAYIKVSYTSQDTVLAGGYANKNAYLRAFIDFNGDGDLNDADDVLTFTAAGSSMSSLTNITATDNPILAGGVNQMQVLAFRVPLTASYRNGTAFMRYRLSWEANLGPDNNAFHQNTAPYVNTSKAYPRGEVEDYAIPLAKVGNLAWFDHDVKGDQNETDFVDTLQLVLVWGGVDETTGSIDSVGYQTTMASEGKITDVLYNLSIVPQGASTMPPNSNDTPGQIVKTNNQGLYSFQGLIPGNYYLIPKKYLQGDSASFVNAWPKHRVLTLKDNPGVDDQNDSDGMPGALIRLKDGNSREPEVCVETQPKKEAGRNDATDQAAMLAMLNPFPDSLYNQTIDFGWVDEPNIEANLDIVGVYFPTSEKCGNMNVILHMCVKNPQEVPLDSLQMFLNLKDAYGSALYTATKPKVSVADSAYIKGPAYGKKKKSFVGAKDLLTPNPNYDGVTDTRLLLVSAENKDFLLKGDSIVCLRIEFEIDPTKTDKYPWSIQGSTMARAVGFNKATGAKRPLTDYFVKSPRFGKTIVVSDLTDEIDDPAATADGIAFEGMVADRGYKGTYQPPYAAPNVTGRDKYLDENDKTIQNDECWLKTKWNAGQHDVVISMNSKCESIVNADVLVPNFVPECGFDKYPEGSYYAVIIQDKVTGETVWTSDDPVPFDGRKYLGRKLIYKVKSVTNFCNPIWGDLTLEDKTAPVVVCPPNTDRKIVQLSPLVTAPYQFVCTDIDSVLNVPKSWNTPGYAYYTGIATTNDACGNARLESVADQLTVFADCALQAANGNAYARIRRVFTFIDENGNRGNCEQIISFYRPVIQLPECKVEVANYLAKGDTAVIPADLVGKYKLAEAVPYIINGAGKRIYATGQDICGFAFSYTDSYEFITGKGLCGRKIIRKWAIFDWCAKNKTSQVAVPTVDGACYNGLTWNDSQYNFEQLIVIGDNTPPIVYALDVDNDGKVGSGYAGAPLANPKTETATYDPGDILVFSTGPMDCTGAFRFTKDQFKVLEQSDWCFEIVDIVERKPILDLFERPTGKFVMTPNAGVKITRDAGTDCKRGYTVAGVPMTGDWFVKLRVNNTCYGDTVVLLPIQIKDKIAPTMKCNDQLNVTLDNVGTGYVTAKNLDKGSFDNCGPLKWIKVRRPVNDTCMSTFLKSWRVIDVNKDGKIGAKDNKEDYIDFNYNGKADDGEYFTISETTKRLMTPLMDTIPVYCCDGGTVMVELWGEDRAGNRNYCWQNLKLDDKTPLVCMPPLNVTIKCTDKNLALIDDKKASAKAFGDVLIMSGNTCVKADTTYKVVKNLTCGAGTIERIWTLSKTTAAGVVKTTCSQIITVEPIHEYSIRFPKDAVQKNCGKPVVDTVLTKELGCDILAVNVADKRYNATEDECYKIFRTYTVINWCTYTDKCTDPKAPENVYVVDRKFTSNGASPIYVLVRQWKPGVYPAQTGSESDLQYFYSLDSIVNNWSSAEIGKLDDGKIEAGNDELLNDPSGDFKYPSSACGVQGKFIHSWMYTQIIKVYDEERPVVKLPKLPTCPVSSAIPGAATINFPIDPASCVGPVTIAFKGTDNCSKDLELEPAQIKIENADGSTRLPGDIDKTWSTARLASDSFKVSIKGVASGSYNLIVVLRDECGNLSVPTRIPFVVGDCKAPVPICINILSTDLMPLAGGGGAMRVWAKDFIASPAYDCNGQGPDTKDGLKLITKYSINRVGKVASADSIGITVTCADKGKAIPVEIHAWDEKGNHDFCVTALEVQDNNKVCPANPGSLGDGEIAGLIQTEAKQSVQGVSVELSGKAVKKMSTASDGKYDFTGLEKGYDYTVTPSLDANPLNGVSTFDLVLMQKHILGIQPLDSPYKMIAADINNSKSITTLDLILLRKLILNLDTKFTANTSWRFVDAAYRFPNPSNPWSESFPEIASINNLNGKANADFVAIKIGDVNGNASPTSAAAAQPRKSGKLELSTEEQRIEGGQEYRVDIRAKDLQTIEGYQFTLEWDKNKVDLVDLEYGVAKAEHFGIFQREGIITTSWNRKGGAENEDAILFTLHLQGKGAAKLSEALTISSRYTANEAYQVGGDYLSVAMSYTKPVVISDRPELLQNTPNPFADQTQIGFYLPQATEGRLTIRDAKGSIVYRLKADYNKGWNQVTIKQSDLKAAGVLYYTLETPDFTATKKMVLLNR